MVVKKHCQKNADIIKKVERRKKGIDGRIHHKCYKKSLYYKNTTHRYIVK